MFNDLLAMGAGGGESNEPFYICLQGYRGYYNILPPSNTIKQYKYVELLSAAKWLSETGLNTVSGTVPNVRFNWTGSSNYTLTPDTPLDISALNIPDNVQVGLVGTETSGTTWVFIPLKFYN